MHKSSTKARFIIDASKCSVKQLTKIVTTVLKLAYKQNENYNF